MEPFYLTAKEFARRGREDFPKEESPSHALIYSSPATLSYNSPGQTATALSVQALPSRNQ